MDNVAGGACADKSLNYGELIEVMNTLRDAGYLQASPGRAGNSGGEAMHAHALHLPDHCGLSRWMVAALTSPFCACRYRGRGCAAVLPESVEPNIIPAISVTLAPVEASSPEVQNQDIAVGPTMQQAEETPKEQPKHEQPVEKVEQPPPPQAQAEVTLPQDTPKQIEEPKPQVQPPAPETRAPPKSERVGQFSQASARAYNALVFGHLQRFKRYPAATHGASGTTVLQFEPESCGRSDR